MRLGIRNRTLKLSTRLARAFGYDLVDRTYRLNSDLRLAALLKHHRINLVFDVGANKGQYGTRLKELGYDGQIVSFEPLSSAFADLEAAARLHTNWKAVNLALGDSNGAAKINVSQNSQSSSLLPSLPALLKSAPKAVTTHQEEVRVSTLDSIIHEYDFKGAKLFLKIDAQGYEAKVLAGARQSLGRMRGIQAESALLPMYAGEILFPEMLEQMSRLGLQLSSLEYGLADRRTGQLLEVDCIFFRETEGDREPA
jgi:FkbM family methyltransferase